MGSPVAQAGLKLSVAKADFKLLVLLQPLSQVLGLQMCATTAGQGV
jgi:hypothetical protein